VSGIVNYLTPAYKDKLIGEINSKDVFIDAEIEGYIHSINHFSWVATTQCCQGHSGNGYLSIMVERRFSALFEESMVPEVISLCEDIYKKFEHISHDTIIARYVFWFKPENRDLFFKKLIDQIKGRAPS